MLDKEILLDQLKYVYAARDGLYADKQTTKKWALTLWAGVLIGILSDKVSLSILDGMWISIAILCMFWLYEGMAGAYGIIMTEHAKKLEKVVVTGDYSSIGDPANYMFTCAGESVCFSKKIQCFIKALFLLETVFVFYGLLSAFTVTILLAIA